MASKREGLHTSHFIYRWSMMKVLIRFTYHRHAWWRQRSKLQIMSSVWRMFGDNSTTKNHRNTKIGGKVVHATPDIPHKFQGQKVKGQGHQVTVGGCSSHHLQGRGAVCGGWTADHTACCLFCCEYLKTSGPFNRKQMQKLGYLKKLKHHKMTSSMTFFNPIDVS